MNDKITDLLQRIRALESELEAELVVARETLQKRLDEEGMRLRVDMLEQQRRFKVGLARYLATASPRHLLSAPFIYAVFPALLLLDGMASLYHAVCFPLYGIPKVRRSDYFVYDRHRLGYLNLLEKLNCLYCSYANGLIAYLEEIVARTEQYWCPIKHAQRLLSPHRRYSRFVEYGEAERYQEMLASLRQELKK